MVGSFVVVLLYEYIFLVGVIFGRIKCCLICSCVLLELEKSEELEKVEICEFEEKKDLEFEDE